VALEVGFAAHLFFDHMTIHTEQLHADVQARLAGSLPQVELLLCEPVGAEQLRLVIDHPEGVDLALCEQVTKELRDLLDEYGIEVSSPGPERPLTKPDHFRRFLGSRARVRTREPRDRGGAAGTARSFTGELVGASDQEVTVAADTGVVSIPYVEISRSNLVTGQPDQEERTHE
jgi:ribosome maturation factor RimP